jgi:hypothetical protein
LPADEAGDIELEGFRLRVDAEDDLLLIVLVEGVHEHPDVGALRRQNREALPTFSLNSDAGKLAACAGARRAPRHPAEMRSPDKCAGRLAG